MPGGDSFLPRIQSVFYAVFDDIGNKGSQIVYQVPEGLIAVPPLGPSSANLNGNGSVPPTPSSDSFESATPSTPTRNGFGLTSRNSSTSLVSPTEYRRPGARHLPSPQNRSNSSQRTLFHFSDISNFVLPQTALCGRLVTCSTERHRIIGFPVQLEGKYIRRFFRYNLCFVFEREADLSCYEPIVRKVSRVLKNCEEESRFLSSPQTSPAVHAILEQLYEDLNSYSETSIMIDQFNSIDLKIFPFYPNPPPLKDWMVPLAVINLDKRREDNWDLTMLKVCEFIDGINHVSRIAHLADCDLSLTRQAISHLLYYQVIMTIDIFQYSNMYTLQKSIQWMADEPHVKEECGPYVTKPGRSIPDWPKLLHLYSRLKPGKTIFEWMKDYHVETLGIDLRRFTSFGVIKGFLRRVHRYPVYLHSDSLYPLSNHSQPPDIGVVVSQPSNSTLVNKRARGLSETSLCIPQHGTHVEELMTPHGISRPQGQQAIPFPSLTLDATPHGAVESPLPSAQPTGISASHRARRASVAEKALEQLRSRDLQKSGSTVNLSPHTSWINFHHETTLPPQVATPTNHNSSVVPSTLLPPTQSSPSKGVSTGRPGSRRHSLITPAVPPSSPVMANATMTPSRPLRLSRSPSATNVAQLNPGQTNQLAVPEGLRAMLDGDHHTDELSVKFRAGWPLLEQWLIAIGGGKGDGDYGSVFIIYR